MDPRSRISARPHALPGVPLTLIPFEVNGGDTWVQDQFQVGYTATPEGNQRVVVHCSRLHNDSAVVPGTPNLRNFVDAFFPSDNIGVLKDLWQTPVRLNTQIAGKRVELDFTQSFLVFQKLMLVQRMLRGLVALLTEVAPNVRISLPPPGDLFAARFALEPLAARLAAQTRLSPEQRARIAQVPFAMEQLSKVVSAKDRRSASTR